MNCLACERPVPEGSPKCVLCGTPVGSKRVARTESHDLELMPEQPASAASTAPFDPPPGVLPGGSPPGPAGGTAPRRSSSSRGAASRGGGGSSKGLVLGGLLALVAVGFIGFKMCGGGPTTKITGRTKFEATLTLYTNSPRVENFEVTGSAKYALEVGATDGDLLIGVARRSPRDPATPAALKKLPEKLTPLRKGETRELTGTWETGQYSWIVLNETKKPVKAKIKFSVQ